MFNNFEKIINNSAKKYKNKDYIISADSLSKKYSFNDLKNFHIKMSYFLSENKIFYQDKILVIMHNSDLLTFLFLTIISNNRVFIPVNPRSSLDEVNYIIKQTQTKIAFISDCYKKKFKKIDLGKKIFIASDTEFIKKIQKFKKKTSPTHSFKKNPVAQILFTSGSTGRPKGVVLTQKSILHNIQGIKQRLGIIEKNPRFLAVTPLFHNNGQFIPTLLPLILGGTTTPIQSETSIINFWPVALKNEINYSSVMSTHINYFSEMKINTKGHKLKWLFCGGAKLDENIRKKFEKKYKIRVATNYGLTETSSIATSEGTNLNERKKGSVGRALYNNKLKILKKNKNDIDGEIYIKGKNLFPYYLNQKTFSKTKFENQWFKSGDLGYLDKDKFLFITDRIDNMIIVSGENIYPSEIEKYLHKIKGIKLGIVSSIPDKMTQNTLILVYEGNKKINKNKLKKILLKYLPYFKIPKLILHCKDLKLREIPKAPNKKILRSKLKKILISKKNLIKKINKL